MAKSYYNIKNLDDGTTKEWWHNSSFDLFLWKDRNSTITTLQLSYDKLKTEKILSWTRSSGAVSCNLIDGGESKFGVKKSPVFKASLLDLNCRDQVRDLLDSMENVAPEDMATIKKIFFSNTADDVIEELDKFEKTISFQLKSSIWKKLPSIKKAIAANPSVKYFIYICLGILLLFEFFLLISLFFRDDELLRHGFFSYLMQYQLFFISILLFLSIILLYLEFIVISIRDSKIQKFIKSFFCRALFFIVLGCTVIYVNNKYFSQLPFSNFEVEYTGRKKLVNNCKRRHLASCYTLAKLEIKEGHKQKGVARMVNICSHRNRDACNDAAWILSTEQPIDPPLALKLALKAVIFKHVSPRFIGRRDTLAVAYAANNNFSKAVEIQKEVVAVAKKHNLKNTKIYEQRLKLFQQNQAFK